MNIGVYCINKYIVSSGSTPDDKKKSYSVFYQFEVFTRKEGQLLPVARNTSSAGIRRDFMPKTVQEWGNAGSQLTLKCTHLRQLGVCGSKSIAESAGVTLGA